MLKLVSGHAIASSGVGSFPASCPQVLARACVFFLLTGQRVIAPDSLDSCDFDSFQYCDHFFAGTSTGASAVSNRVSGTDCASVFLFQRIAPLCGKTVQSRARQQRSRAWQVCFLPHMWGVLERLAPLPTAYAPVGSCDQPR